jgi:phage FluMu protein Com
LNVIFNFRDVCSMPSSPSEITPAGPEADDCRCLCGSLLARVVDGYVELKCRRCKRTLQVPVSNAPGDAPAAADHPVRQAV